MLNVLLLPELRELLTAGDEKTLTEVLADMHPASIAEFSEGLSIEETWQLLGYVVNDARQLIGFVSLRDLIIARRSALVGQIMERDVVTVPVDKDQEDAARELAHYAMLPLLFKRLGVDPGYASSPFVATFVDVTGIVLYFSIARIYLL